MLTDATPVPSASTPRSRHLNFLSGTRVAHDYTEKLRAEAIARFQQSGTPYPGDERVGSIVQQALANANAEDLKAGIVRGEVLMRLDDLVRSAASETAQRPVNITSAEAARAERGNGPSAGRLGGRHADGIDRLASYAAARSASSGSYRNELPDRGMAQAQDLARSLGLSWAAENPHLYRDLFRLGPSAVRALADVKLSEATFTRMRGEGGFSAKGIVTMAKFAKETGREANKLGNDLTDSITAIAAADPKLAQQMRKAAEEFMENHRKPEAKEKFDAFIAKSKTENPALAKDLDKVRATLLESQARELGAANKAQADTNKAQADANKASADTSKALGDVVQKTASLDAFNAAPAAPAPSRPPAPPSQPPAAQAPKPP